MADNDTLSVLEDVIQGIVRDDQLMTLIMCWWNKLNSNCISKRTVYVEFKDEKGVEWFGYTID